MGTSQSSKGPGSNVSMVPSWVADVSTTTTSSSDTASGAEDENNESNNNPNSQTLPAQAQPSLMASIGRFGAARTNISSYAKSGDKKDMRRGVGQYIKKGYGGTNIASKRFSGAVTTAGALHSALADISEGNASGILDSKLLAGKTAREIIDAVVEAVRPIDGSQDAEAGRLAISDALSDLLVERPNANLLELSDDERNFVTERYIALDVFKRFELDLGFTIQEKAPSVAFALTRLKEVREYIKETISASFQKIKKSGEKINSKNITKIAQDALRQSLVVFQEYAI